MTLERIFREHIGNVLGVIEMLIAYTLVLIKHNIIKNAKGLTKHTQFLVQTICSIQEGFTQSVTEETIPILPIFPFKQIRVKF